MATPIPKNQARFSLAQVAEITGGLLIGDDLEIEGVAIDSRAVSPGSLFVAVRGVQQDGAAYIPAATDAGAVALLVHRGSSVATSLPRVEVDDTTRALGALAALHRKRWGRSVVAITGSVGKTTTKDLTAAAFAATSMRVHKTTGNLNNQFGVPMTLLGLTSEHDLAVLEVGTSGPGEIALLGALVQPDVAAVLVAAAAHTEGLGTVSAVADEKASLFRTLRAGGKGVVNVDDAELSARTPHDLARISFGTSEHAQVRLVSARLRTDGTEVVVSIKDFGELTLSLSLIGYAAALDACAALACVLALRGEHALLAASGGLSGVQPAPGRMAPHRLARGVVVIDDTYNANPRSAQVSLETLKELTATDDTRSIAVLSDMKELGNLSQMEHARLGEFCVRNGIDVLIGCGPEMVHATALAARLASGRLAPHPTRVMHLTDPLEAIRVVRSFWRGGDVVLIKGSRSMLMERVVQGLCQGEAVAS
jgi:UDP-N-acetylmuramoyl-tripeptide--D-alanyl-D-alanine ligase